MKVKKIFSQLRCDFCNARSEWFEEGTVLGGEWLEHDYFYDKPPYYDLAKYGRTFCSQKHRDLWIEQLEQHLQGVRLELIDELYKGV